MYEYDTMYNLMTYMFVLRFHEFKIFLIRIPYSHTHSKITVTLICKYYAYNGNMNGAMNTL